jgi:hypothetical protein
MFHKTFSITPFTLTKIWYTYNAYKLDGLSILESWGFVIDLIINVHEIADNMITTKRYIEKYDIVIPPATKL